MKNKLLLILKKVAFPFAVLAQIVITLIVTPFVLRKKRLEKGARNAFNSDKKILIFGKRIIESMKGLEISGFPVKTMIEGKHTIYTVSQKNYILNVDVNTNWLGLDFNVIDSKNKILIDYSVDTDLYPINLPEYGKFAREIEEQIVNFIDALAEHKVSIGTFKKYPAIATQSDSGYFIRYAKSTFFGKISSIENATIKSIKKFKELGTFTTI